LGAARVCSTTSAAPASATASASAGSRSPLTSLIIAAPAASAARATWGLNVSTRHRHPLGGEALDERHHALRLDGGKARLVVGDAALGADVDQVGALGDELQRVTDLRVERRPAHRVGERVGARVDDPHDERAAPAQLDDPTRQDQARGTHDARA
jgi:hypothetical protein